MTVSIQPWVELCWFDTVDPTVAPGVSAPLYQPLIRTDVPSFYWKSGPADTDWTLIGDGSSGPPSSAMRFSYTVTGLEPDLNNIVVPLPSARASATYNVQVTQGTFTFILSPACPVSGRTTTQLVLSLSAPATAGDTFDFSIADPS